MTERGGAGSTGAGGAAGLGQRVLLTGATGRVGARFLPQLRARGAQPRLAIWAPGPAAAPAGAAVVSGDLTDPQTCRRAVSGMDAIVHIAAAFVGITPGAAADLNFRATRQLGRAALAAGVRRFVQLSSYLVYAPTPGRPTREDDRLRAPDGSPFAAAKLGAERAAAELAGTALRVTVLRLGFTYGERDPHLAEAFDWARHGPPGRRLHLVHHADVRQSVLHALGSPAGGVYNIADDAPVCAAELAALAAELAVPPERPEAAAHTGGDRAGDPGGHVDTTAARTGLGFAPAYPSIRAAHEAGAI